MKREMKLAAVATATAILAGCASGGGGAEPTPPYVPPAPPKSSAEIAECLIYPNYCREKAKLQNSLRCLIDPLGCYRYLQGIRQKEDQALAANGKRSMIPGPFTIPGATSGDSTGQGAGKPPPFASWSVSRYSVANVEGPMGMAIVNVTEQFADGARIASSYVGHGDGARILDYDASGQLREFGNGVGSYAPRPELAERYGQSGIDAAWSTTNSRQTAFSTVQTDGVALIANPYDLGWNYQSFGVWSDPVNAATEYVRGLSFGNATPVAALPVSGQADFAGKLAGMYISPAGKGGLASADLGVHVDFAARTVSLASTGTMANDGRAWTPNSSLDVTGTLSYSPASARFSGTLVNGAGTMSGTSSGQFYGPAAQELGGEFVLKSATTAETLVGAYGAKR